ncbi:MAG: glycosyltransferase family 2 protein, partial [Bacteroidales bacterium]|nr:glycosyltransferase family 2 protein [Bacteroidales bacterium]
MKNQRVAVLLTCHNRKAKTLDCLASFYRAVFPSEYTFDIFLTDDGSTDGTGEALKKLYPQITLIQGSGNLFWAGGMRMAWESAMRECSYDAFLLLNDDVMLNSDFLLNLMKTEEHSLQKRGKKGIYSGATVDETTGIVSYGGSKIKANHIVMKSQLLSPREFPQECEITN